MFAQIGAFLIETVFGLFIFALLARFHFQWLRVPFRNPLGEFLIVLTNWIVLPVRRVVPGLAGLDIATLILAWLGQMASLWLQAAVFSGQLPSISPLALAAVAAVDLVRFSLYILSAALIVQIVFSWINPYSDVGPVLDAFTRPFLRPLRRYIKPLGRFDLVPFVLLVLLQILLIVIEYVRRAAGGL